MKLISGADYIIVKRAGYFGGRRTLQYHGNMVVTKNRIIVNILQTIDMLEKMADKRPTAANPFKEIKEATKDLKQSLNDAKDDFKKIKDFGICLGILEQIAAESQSVEELESRVAAMGEDESKSLNIALSDIQSIKFGWLSPVKVVLKNGVIIKLFITKHRKDVKTFLSRYIQ
jgi:aspartokinase